MKNNKLLVVIILLGFLSFGMKYNTIIKNNVVAPIVESLTKAETAFIDQKEENEVKESKSKAKETSTPVVAATVTVTNAVAVNGGGNAKPGSQLDYTITISNSGTDDATGLSFQDVLDSNLTLVTNSFKATPIANNNSYSCIGNVGITVDAAGGVLSNDASPDGTTLTATVLTAPANGTVNLSPNGSFTYNSNAGYSGTDSFTYTATTGSGKTSTGTVNITVSTPIVFVNGSALTTGNGTLATPYKALNSVTNSGTSPIFIYSAAATAAGILTLNDNQKVIGQGATTSLVFILNLTVPTYSNALPSTGGTNPTIGGINLKLNNDIQAVAMTGTLSGTNVGALKIKNASINAITQAIAISGGGSIDCNFTSVSASGSVTKGISVNSPGTFQITGTGTTAGSGGTVQNTTGRGAEFISCSSVTLKNMNFTNSSTSGVNSNATNPQNDNTNSNAALHFKTISGSVTLDKISISGTTNSMGINLNNVNNFVLSNSTITGCGSANNGNPNVGGIFALELKGTCSITNTNVNDSWGRGFFGYNGISQNPTLNLTVTNCQFKNTSSRSNGDSNFIFEAKGTSNNTLVFKKNDFSFSKATGLALNFNGSSVNTIQIGGPITTDANIINASINSPGSNGLSLQVNGSATATYNIVNNTIKSSYDALSACSIGNQGSGTIKGRINNNTIDAGLSIGNGITVSAYGNAKHITEVANNTITNVKNYGIVSEANDNATISSGRIDATITGNNISVANNAYTHIGIIAYADIASSTMKSAAKVTGNTVNVATGLVTGNFDVLSQGINSEVILEGLPVFAPGMQNTNNSSQLQDFWKANNNNNTGTAFHEPAYTGKIISGMVIAPDNGNASKMAPQNNQEEATPTPEPTVNNINTIANNSNTAKNAAVTATATTISAGPFTLGAGKNTVITFSATINAAGTLPQNTCSVTNQATVSGSNFATVNSNITTTSIKPSNATVTTDTQNIPCLGTTAVNLNATCPLGTTATWYTAMTGGTSFANGASVSATPTANNTTYCVACEAAYCASDRVLVKTVTGTPSTSTTQTETACDSYTWAVDGTKYTNSGTYTNTVGCDTKILNLTITPSTIAADEVVAACDSYTWAANGTKYTNSGTYTNKVGCETRTLKLTITPSTSLPDEVVAVCDSYTWAANGTKYTNSGTYTNKVGCETRTLKLTITPSTSLPDEVVAACDSYTWAANGTKYTNSGTYTNKVGCETRTLKLTITPSTSLPDEIVAACDSYTWAANDTKYTNSGTYTNKVGCETRTLKLTITPSTSLPDEVVAVCDSYTWAANGTKYTSSGTYTNKVGCETRTLKLTITPSTSLPDEIVAACDSYTWAANGTKYTNSGTYTNKVGCETRTLKLTITPSTSLPDEVVAACDSYTWAANGTKYTSSGTYTNKVGCETRTLKLTITPSTSVPDEVVAACDSYTWAANGTKYTNSGTYTNKVGCETRTLKLTITPSTSLPDEVVAACDSYTWAANGTKYTSSGTYTNTVGCETRTLILTITNSTSSTQTETACDSYTWPVNGTKYTATGIYTYTVGCDTKTLNLTITNSTNSTQTETACGSFTWAENGTKYTATGIYTYTVGCDTKTLNLTITNSTNSTQTETACGSFTWPINGTKYTATGIYTYTVGCDTKTLNLTITNSTSSTQTETACDSYTWPVNGIKYTATGIYTYTVGCDTKTLNLTIHNSSTIEKTVGINAGILTANQMGATYQWYKCPNTLLFNETNASYTPSTVGDYRVEIKVGECSISSDCITVTTLTVDQFESNEFKMYPIPSRGTLNVVTKYEGNYIIIDASGKIVKTITLDANIVNTLHLDNLTDGVYLIKNLNKNNFKAQKFIIKR